MIESWTKETFFGTSNATTMACYIQSHNPNQRACKLPLYCILCQQTDFQFVF